MRRCHQENQQGPSTPILNGQMTRDWEEKTGHTGDHLLAYQHLDFWEQGFHHKVENSYGYHSLLGWSTFSEQCAFRLNWQVCEVCGSWLEYGKTHNVLIVFHDKNEKGKLFSQSGSRKCSQFSWAFSKMKMYVKSLIYGNISKWNYRDNLHTEMFIAWRMRHNRGFENGKYCENFIFWSQDLKSRDHRSW